MARNKICGRKKHGKKLMEAVQLPVLKLEASHEAIGK